MATSATASLEQLAGQKAGRYLLWLTQSEAATAVNSVPTVGGGVDVSDSQLAKICVDINGNCTSSFSLYYRYTERDEFSRVDQSERIGVTYNWTQQADISGVEEIFIYVSAYTNGGGGSYDIYVAPATSTGSV